jgi:hypothetical protein
MKEYTSRGPELENSSYLEFFLNTYEGEQMASSRKENETRGRQPNERVQYAEGAGKGAKRCVVRARGHETMAEFIGEWFPRDDDPDEGEFYSAWMLALLVPWRKMVDICGEDQAFSIRFERFKASTTKGNKDILKGIQYYWE